MTAANSHDLAIDNVTLVLPDRLLPYGRVLVRGGRITAAGRGANLPARAETTFDGQGLLLAPGFIDLQCNGGFGLDFTTQPETIWAAAGRLPTTGVTTFLPTIITCPLESIAAARIVLGRRPENFRGANPLGLHVEGPFLNPAKKGAHNPAYMRAPEVSLVQEWSPVSGVRLVTLAPELDPAGEVIGQLVDSGVIVSAGHSTATWVEATAAIDQGVRSATHLFNAMPPLHHREPGLVGAVLADQRLKIGLIPDGVHVHPGVVQMVWLAARGRIYIVTDSMAAMGMPPGRYQLGDFAVQVDERQATLPDGTLAGSIVGMDTAVRRFHRFSTCSIPEAVAAATLIPAALLGLADQVGRLARGYPADCVLLTPDLQLVATWIAGELVYHQADESD